jgi:NAD(P)H-dependent FMN reductase
LPLPDGAHETQNKVRGLRDLVTWSEGQVWSSPERHGAMSGIMKAQIDWVPLSIGAVRPTQGKTLAMMQVSGGSQSFCAGAPITWSIDTANARKAPKSRRCGSTSALSSAVSLHQFGRTALALVAA